jgi:hypothetical protein
MASSVRKFFLAQFHSDNYWTIGTRHVKFGREIDHKHAYKICLKYFLMLEITNMATVRNFELKSDTFNIGRICISVRRSPQIYK